MSPPASERAERIARDVPITPHVAPLGSARTAQRAVPTYRTAFANHRHGRAGVLACRFARLPAVRWCSTDSSLQKVEAGCPKNRRAGSLPCLPYTLASRRELLILSRGLFRRGGDEPDGPLLPP